MGVWTLQPSRQRCKSDVTQEAENLSFCSQEPPRPGVSQWSQYTGGSVRSSLQGHLLGALAATTTSLKLSGWH